MTANIPLSVFIIAKNEADRIAWAIDSVKHWAAEVIVIDSGSDDDTVTVAEQAGARVMFNEWPGYGPQKRFAETQCQNDWVLNIDADEAVSGELAVGIQALFTNGEPADSAYELRIKTLFDDEETPPLFAPAKWMVRLYDRRKAGFKDSTVHDSVEVNEGTVGRVQGLLLHRSFRDFHHWADKINRYSTMQADDWVAKGRKPSALRIIFEPPLAFLKAYVLRRYICYGINGIVASRLYAHGRMLRLAKVREKIRLQQRLARRETHVQKET